MTHITLHYGHETLPITIPSNNLGEVIRPRSVQPARDPLALIPPLTLIRAAIDAPIGTRPLAELVRAGQTVAIIVDDVTRATPAHLILPLLLEQLHGAGVRDGDIRLVIALGTHRPMSEAEIVAKVGADVAARYQVVNMPSSRDEEMVYMGTSQNGIPAWVNRAVASADVKIGVGSITPHMDAGYSGGAKIILPGVCSTHTVETFHSKETDIHFNLLGRLDSPIRQDLEQFVGDCVGLDFIVNTILTPDEQLYQCVAGHFIEAHRVGVRYTQDVYGVPVSRRYPIVLANAYPKDIDLWQCTNALSSGEIIIEEGGTLILLAEARDRHSAYPNFPHRIGSDPDELKRAFDAGEISERMTAIFGIGIGRFKRRFDIYLVSKHLTRADAEIMGFAYHESVEDAIHSALEKQGAEAKVAILTHGAITLPLLEG